MQPLPTYSALHVVSDLHLGGEPGLQMFDQGPLLAATIDGLAQGPHAGEGRVALVLNGDVVDFLAEPRARHLDPEGAVAKLARIYGDPAFAPVWAALEGFVARPGRELVLVLGNHDVELALHHVREWLAGRLSRGSDAARGRIRFALDGAGFACGVGGRRALCLHKAAVQKRIGEAWFRISALPDAGRKRPVWIRNSRDALHEARRLYEQAARDGFGQSETGRRGSKPMHWYLTQYLAVAFVLGESLDPRRWEAAMYSVEVDLASGSAETRTWAHGSAAELWLLRHAESPAKGKRAEAAPRGASRECRAGHRGGAGRPRRLARCRLAPGPGASGAESGQRLPRPRRRGGPRCGGQPAAPGAGGR